MNRAIGYFSSVHVFLFILNSKECFENMREYDKSHVEFLHLQQTPEMVNGAPIIIKRSPTEPRPGCADHHEDACMKMHWVAREKGEEEKPKTPAEALQQMRDNMGFPNHNICTAEIHTKFETIMNGEMRSVFGVITAATASIRKIVPALSSITAADGSAAHPIP